MLAGKFPERLETPRLLLSRPAAADLPDLVALHTDPLVMATLGGLRTPDELDAMHRRLFACWDRDGFGWWVARQRPDGRFVGRGGLRRVQVGGRDEVEVGYGLAAASARPPDDCLPVRGVGARRLLPPLPSLHEGKEAVCHSSRSARSTRKPHPLAAGRPPPEPPHRRAVEDLLRDLAFVLHATRAVRKAMTGTKAAC